MSQDDSWYRSTGWSKKDQDLFYEKIGRSRSNYHRQQYARIKAYSLIETQKPEKIKAAIELLQKSIEEWQCEFPSELDNTYAALGDAYRSLGDYTQASSNYESSITWRTNNIHRGYWDYAEMVITQEDTDKYNLALEIVNKLAKDEALLLLETDKFIYHATRAIVFNYQDGANKARIEALDALATVNAKKSLFRYHPDVGLVDAKKYKKLIRKLKVIAN